MESKEANPNSIIPLDTCLFKVKNFYDEPLRILSQIEACTKCPLVLQQTVQPYSSNTNLFLSTKYHQIIQIIDKNSKIQCQFNYRNYQDQAIYNLNLLTGNTTSDWLRNRNCTIEQVRKGRHNEWPLVILCSIIFSVICISLLRNLFKTYLRNRRQSDLIENTLCRLDSTIKHSDDLNSTRIKRSTSVDVFRGFVILLMIFVNYGAGGYVFLNHAPWFGLNLADIVFPAFLFLMGTSIGLSFKNLVTKQENLDPKQVYLKIVKRSLILFTFGLIINSIGQNDLTKLRIPGVLQRFAICYFVMAFLHFNSLLNINSGESKYLRIIYKFYFADIYPFYLEWLLMIALSGVYLYFTLFFEYDYNCPIGYQGPGGLHMNGTNFNCTGGAARQIDIWVFGSSHIYQHSTSREIFQNQQNHDPEGLLGTIGSLLIVFLGLQVAKIHCSFTDRMKLTRYTIYTVVLGTSALILHFTGCIPICKNLWSLSFVFITSSICFLIFTFLYIIIEIKGYWLGQPLKDTGKNALFLYLGHEILGSVFPFYYQVDDSSHYLLLMRCSIATFIWLMIAIYMGQKKVLIKI